MDIVITGANGETPRSLVAAAAAAGVKTFVYLSFPGADPVSQNGYLRAGALVPSLGWNRSVFDILLHEHLADSAAARATLPFALTPVQAALDHAVAALD